TAEDVNARIVKGGAAAEEAIRDVVSRIARLRDEDRSPVLRELFGKESIGAIGPLATNIDLLTQAFDIAGDKAKALHSVQTEYEKRSKTTAAAIERLKANIATLAIELGDALLPHINKVVDFLTSPEGKEWGRSAVAKAKDVVVGFADAVMTAGRLLNDLINTFGGATTAVGLLGAAVFALTGPFSAAIAAAVAFGAAAGKALDAVLSRAQKMELALARLRNEADAIRNKEAQDELDEARREGDQTSLEIRQ